MALYDNSYVIVFEDGAEFRVQRRGAPQSPIHVVHTVKQDETLFDISKEYYHNTKDWYLIAEANNIVDPLVIWDPKWPVTLIIPNNG